MNRISKLGNEDILRMVYIDSAQYRPEAIVYAKAEIDRRGLSVDELNSIGDLRQAPSSRLTLLGYRLLATIRRRAFAVGFLIVLLFFVIANIYSYINMPEESGSITHGFVECGYPLELYKYGGYIGTGYILWDGLVADVLIAVLTGVLIGVTFKLLFGGGVKRPAV
jgi:hypothetical protein